MLKLVTDPLTIVTFGVILGQIFGLVNLPLYVLLGLLAFIGTLLGLVTRAHDFLRLLFLAACIGFSQIYFLGGDGPLQPQARAILKIRVLSEPKPGMPGELKLDVLAAFCQDGSERLGKFQCRIPDLPWRNVRDVYFGGSYWAEAKIGNLSTSAYDRALKRRGFLGRCQIRFISHAVDAKAEGLVSFSRSLRQDIEILLAPYQAGGIIRALILGDRGGISRNFEERTRRFGIAHLFVVSGLHIAVLYGVVLGVIRLVFSALIIPFGFFRLSRLAASLLSIGFVWAYVFFIGSPLSAMRAVITLTCAEVFRMTSDSHFGLAHGMIFSLLVLCGLWPGVFEELAFVLTYGALVAIALAGGLHEKAVVVMRERKALFFAKTVYFAVIPSVVTSTILYLWIGRFTILGVLGNLILTPIILGVGFVGSLIAFGLSFISRSLSDVVFYFVSASLVKIDYTLMLLQLYEWLGCLEWFSVLICLAFVLLVRFTLNRYAMQRRS